MKKILIVDDDPDIVEVVGLILKRNGFTVYTHNSGLGVPEMVKKIAPDLILLDIRLPGKFGTYICKELKSTSKYPPILLFSAHEKEGEAFAICKADGFIQKPFDAKHLIEIINSHLVAA
jgi:two-component system, OmpR family, alkaline phosphatase synthesis response regulator PhoP